MYFVTFRLKDSIPNHRIDALKQARKQWGELHKEPYTPLQRQELRRLFSAPVEQWLDNGGGQCLLKEEACRGIVAETLEYFEGERYFLDDWVIMPNHVHVLVASKPDYPLKKILQTWKSFSAKSINKLKNQTGSVWQGESFDHLVRSPAHLNHYRHYIRSNPHQAYLKDGMYSLRNA